jgi:protein-S-isoprenylcysteine O-methyltransferase Ste14
LNAAHVTPDNPRRLAFLVFGRLLPLAFFALLLAVQAQLMAPEIANAIARFPDADTSLLAASRVVQLLFVAGIALIYLVRKPPVGRRHQPIAVLVAFYASFVLLALRPLQSLAGVADGQPTRLLLLLSNVLVLAGLVISLYSLYHLRLSFSIVPEARELVTGGPYQLVRHPIYLGEIATGLGLVFGLWTWFAAAIWLSMVGAQLVRTHYEEDVLRESFPEYQSYAKRTKRVIPWLA